MQAKRRVLVKGAWVLTNTTVHRTLRDKAAQRRLALR